MTQVIDVIDRFEQFAPLTIAEPGDPTGFQIGSKRAETKRIMTTLDVRPEVVEEAIKNNVDFIFAHHPVMFHPTKKLDLANPQNKMYAKILKHNITVYAAHTNLDNANGGMNDWLADLIGLKDVSGLVPFKGNIQGTNGKYFMGRIGELKQAITIDELSQKLKKEFNISGLRLVTFNPNKLVNKIAILGGDGGKFYHYALDKGADVYITGDLYYHTAQDLLAYGLSAIDPGHHVESICKSKLKELLDQWKREENWDVDVMASQLNTDPYTFK